MYNAKVLIYPDGTRRLYYYSRPVITGNDRDTRVDNPYTAIEPFRGTHVRVVDDLTPDPTAPERSLRNSMSRSRQKVYDYSLSNNWDLFVTLTFSPDLVDRYDYASCVAAMKQFLRYLRRHCPDVRYLIVPELHKDGAYHFHGLIGGCDALPLVDSGVRRKGQTIYNITGYKHGFSTATRIRDNRKAGAYLAKYITKDLCSVSKGRKRYWISRNLSLPEKLTMIVDLSDDREQVLDNLFDVSSFYKASPRPDGSMFFFYEFSPQVDLDLVQAFSSWMLQYSVKSA